MRRSVGRKATKGTSTTSWARPLTSCAAMAMERIRIASFPGIRRDAPIGMIHSPPARPQQPIWPSHSYDIPTGPLCRMRSPHMSVGGGCSRRAVKVPLGPMISSADAVSTGPEYVQRVPAHRALEAVASFCDMVPIQGGCYRGFARHTGIMARRANSLGKHASPVSLQHPLSRPHSSRRDHFPECHDIGTRCQYQIRTVSRPASWYTHINAPALV
ncbi:hypothetical protein GY45DRAFT_1320841 [Cubamyces sp. BRFM 1775]|nr:hypothetical protein GY45DRAFT_1320841 [Cubamyces sp. BRFM 1775]